MKTKYGHMACLSCGERVVVKINENETLGYSCDECGSVSYARKGEGQYPLWLKRITRATPADPAPAPAPKPPKPADPATPPAKKPATYYG